MGLRKELATAGCGVYKQPMVEFEQFKSGLSRPMRISYLVMLGMFISLVWLHLATPLLVVLLTYLALTRLHFKRRGGKWLAVGILLILLSGIIYALGYFINHTVRALPEIAEKAIPSIIQWARQYQIEVPFTDYDSLKESALEMVKGQAHYLGSFAKVVRGAGVEVLFLAAGLVIAISLFLNPQFELGRDARTATNNLYSHCCEEVARRFRTFYHSFVTVMGAQIIISAINTVLTAIFVLAVQLPYGVVIIGMTFLCGLLPVVGNLISNTVVVGIGFTVSPKMALVALTFLVTIHKLEYFLNSKIIGWRIRNPFWLTIIGLIIGERLLGIPGMVLAPVVLNYLKLEVSRMKVPDMEPAECAVETRR